jgi:hypothetical protein
MAQSTLGVSDPQPVTGAAAPTGTITTGATAAQAAPTDNRVVDATKRVAGFTAGVSCSARNGVSSCNCRITANPYAGTGDNCMSAGHKDKVLILWTTGAPAPRRSAT